MTGALTDVSATGVASVEARARLASVTASQLGRIGVAGRPGSGAIGYPSAVASAAAANGVPTKAATARKAGKVAAATGMVGQSRFREGGPGTRN